VTGGGVVLVVSLVGLGGPALSLLLGINVFGFRLSSRGSDSDRRWGTLQIRATVESGERPMALFGFEDGS
jgi:hypothetical protein